MSSSDASHWQMCRLRRRTVARLKDLIQGLEWAREAGRNKHYDGPGEQGYTVDLLVQILLDREEKKRARARKSRSRKNSITRGDVLPMLCDPLGLEPEPQDIERWLDDGGKP